LKDDKKGKAPRQVNKVPPERLVELDSIVAELKRRGRLKSFDAYKPKPWQLPIHEAMKKKRLVLMTGGNGIGKTHTAIGVCLAWIKGERPWDGSKTPRTPPVDVLYVAPDFTNYHAKKTIPLIFKLMPHEAWEHVLTDGRGLQTMFRHANGSTLHLMAYEQHLRKAQDQASPFEGIDFDLAVFDEPAPREVFIAIERGVMKRNGKILMVLTPIAEPWIFDQLYEPGLDPASDIGTHTISAEVAVRSETNPEGIWEREAFDHFRATVSGEDHEDARIHGHFKHLAGLVFKEYDPAYHIFDPAKLEIRPEWPKGLTIDPHDKKPFMMAWWAVNPEGQILFFKEWPTSPFHEYRSCDYTWDDYAAFIKAEEEKIPGGAGSVIYRFMDPNFGRSSKASAGVSISDYLGQQGMYFDTTVDDSLQNGHAAIRRRLSFDRNQPLSPTNHPMLRISKACWNLDYAFRHYIWDEVGSVAKEKPKDHAKDAMDVMRYTAAANPEYITTDMLVPHIDLSIMANSGLGR
jgi:hypothetical protein